MPKSCFTRSSHNPILSPIPENIWESVKVYNPGALYDNGKYHIFYRAVGKGADWHSVIGHAVSDDGESFLRDNNPLLERDNDSELRGLEDPRISKVCDTFFLSYTAYDGVVPRISIATSKDLCNWNKHGFAFDKFPFYDLGGFRVKWENKKPAKYYTPTGIYDRTKSGAIFPEKISGKYWMLFNEYLIWLATSDDGIRWQYEPKSYLTPREGNYFDSVFVEMGPPPIKTEKGWLVLYHGVDSTYTYRIGFLLLDLNNPHKILFRSPTPIYWPEADYELSGLVDKLSGREKHTSLTDQQRTEYLNSVVEIEIMPKVTFCCGATLTGDELRIFYGAGDTFICTAKASITNIFKSFNL